ncbi:MAG: isoleucine--tRNA ligase [Alphaproteobacteria bacterium]|nr:isoleucine--tRNA ligase [Alphaproteobacteria bacterium]
MTRDYKSTVFLPKTDFPMKAGLPENEPKHLARWQAMGLFQRLRDTSKGREKFVLHDGPPYANGHLHIGHALNKILKDIINRGQQMMGKDANYVPGWDCHGLPIEWKIEEKYREAGKDKDQVPIVAFRAECRNFAAHWLDVQREEFKRLGVEGDWDHPYSTMSFEAEAAIAAEIWKFTLNGGLYKGAKPVMWSVVEKTALAEAEVEYHDHTSYTIWIGFPVVKPSRPELEGARIVIWTTTPWTMPGNRAIAYGAEVDYVLIEIGGSLGRIVVAKELLEQVIQDAKIEGHKVIAGFKGSDLAGTVCAHPWRGQGYDFDVPLLAGDFVTTDQGTGFVHMAPGHGEDDWLLCRQHKIKVPETVGDDGTYYDHVPMFAGLHVFKAHGPVIEAMQKAGALLAHDKIKHSYPHSWRSKAPLIFRTTPQWFISMDTNDLRKKALSAIDATRFVPDAGRNRIGAMIEQRPDWCVSRQRAWGVPIAVFTHKKTGELLKDERVMQRIVDIFKAEGSDAWFARDPADFLAPDYDANDYERVNDILDVWFDSGSTHAFVCENGPWDLQWPASLYLEGSDQHRGWFHSSLLEACGTRGRAPYDAVLTHGFVLDEQGRKMSKSLGNVVAPQDVVAQWGADILRLWVASSDTSLDLRVGPEILKQQVDVYRRLRNTLRYLLGALDGLTPVERVEHSAMPELERWVLHRIFEMDRLVRQACNDFTFHPLFTELHTFCTVDLSAFYFDIRKDSLYCDHPKDAKRRACRTVMETLYDCLTAWLAPFICFTAEEAWLSRHPGEQESVHLRTFPDIPHVWQNEALAKRWEKVRDIRKTITGRLEEKRAAKEIRSSLEAAITLYLGDEDSRTVQGIDWSEVAIVSASSIEPLSNCPTEDIRRDATVILTGLQANASSAGSSQTREVTPSAPSVNEYAVGVRKAEGKKCQRCWKVLPDVPEGGVCPRCADVVYRPA